MTYPRVWIERCRHYWYPELVRITYPTRPVIISVVRSACISVLLESITSYESGNSILSIFVNPHRIAWRTRVRANLTLCAWNVWWIGSSRRWLPSILVSYFRFCEQNILDDLAPHKRAPWCTKFQVGLWTPLSWRSVLKPSRNRSKVSL